MALLKTIPTAYGVDAEYWKVVETNTDWLNRRSHVTMHGWLDQQARVDDKTPLTSRVYDWLGDDFPFVESEPQNEREIAYLKIKADAEFSGAEDC